MSEFSAVIHLYKPICIATGRLFPDYVEVVLHDLTTQKIAFIENVFSNRAIGDDSLVCIDELERDADDNGVVGPYEKINSDGTSLKSITTIIRNEEHKAIGLMCVNFKTTSFKLASELLNSLTQLPTQQAEQSPKSLFQGDWREQVNSIIRQTLITLNTTLVAAKRSDKKAILEAIEQAGVFGIRGSSNYVAQTLGISRANLYEILRNIRKA